MKKAYHVLIIVALLSLIEVTQSKIEIIRLESRAFPSEVVSLSKFLEGGAIRSLRSLTADLLWIRLDYYSHTGQHYKIYPLVKTVALLQPKFIQAWTLGGWHMAYNIYHVANGPAEKRKWLERGLSFLREGIIENPDTYRIYYELGWTYFFKLKDYPGAIKYLKRAVQYGHPQFVTHVLAHSYERNGQIRKSLAVWESLYRDPQQSPGLSRVVRRKVRELSDSLSKE